MAPSGKTESKVLDSAAIAELCVRRIANGIPGLAPTELEALSNELRIRVRRGAGRTGAPDLAERIDRLGAQSTAGYRRRRTVWESVLLPWVDESVDGALPSTISTGALGHLVDRAWFAALEILAGGVGGASAQIVRARVDGTPWSALAEGAGLPLDELTERWRRGGRQRLALAARQAGGLFLYWKWFEGEAADAPSEAAHSWTRRRLVAFAARLLDDVDEQRFRRHLDGCGSCWFALGAITEDPRPEEARDGHIPASVLARWERAGDDLAGLERALVRRHLARCESCREDLRHVGFGPNLPVMADDAPDLVLREPEGEDAEDLLPSAPAAGTAPTAVGAAANPVRPEPAAVAVEPEPEPVRRPVRPPSPFAPAGPSSIRLEDDHPEPESAPSKAGGAPKGAIIGAGAPAPQPRSWPIPGFGRRGPRGNLARLTEDWNLLREYMVGGPAALKPEAAEEFLAVQVDIVRILRVFPDEFRAANLREMALQASRLGRDLLEDIPTIKSMQSRLGENREELDRIWHEVFLILAELGGHGR